MPIPAYTAEQLEKAALILGGAPLMIMSEQQGTASAANPAGLRVAGGNLFRDYTPWTEQEITDFSMGMGHNKIGSNGFLTSLSTDTIHDGLRMQAQLDTLQTFNQADQAGKNWTTDPLWESKIVKASDGNLYAFAGTTIYQYNETTSTWASWFDVQGASVFNAAYADRTRYYVIDMCSFNGNLIVVITPHFRAIEPTVSAGSDPVDPPLINEFDFSIWILAPQARSNVLAINLASKKPYLVGKPGAFLPISLDAHWDAGVIGPYYRFSGLCATTCHSYGGYLFIGGSAGYMYTNGEVNTTYAPPPGTDPNSPAWWGFEGSDSPLTPPHPGGGVMSHHRLPSPFNLSTKYGGDTWATGFAGIQGQSIGDFAVYMSTSEGLYLLDLAIPVAVKVLEYQGKNVRNGRGMISYNNDLYIPVNNGIMRFTQTGQVVQVGLNTVPEMPDNTFSYHVQLTASPNVLISTSMSRGTLATTARVLGLKGQGWHDLQTISTTAYANAVHYRARTNTIHLVALPLRSSGAGPDPTFRKFQHLDSVNDIEDSATAYPYTSTPGTVYLGTFDAGAPLLEKDWHSISVFGSCFSANTTVQVQYKITNSLDECGWLQQWGTSGWVSAGIVNTNVSSKEFILPNTADCAASRAGRYISLRLVLDRNSSATYLYQSPVVSAVKLKYFVPIDDYFRFSYNVILPAECLRDLCGNEFAGYSQSAWRAAVQAAVCSVEPVRFRDMDGRWYQVRVESASRRIDGVSYQALPTPHREWDETWSLVMVQLKPVSLCDADWTPAVCP